MEHYGTVSEGQAWWDARGYAGVLTQPLLVLGSAHVDSVGWKTNKKGAPIPLFPGTPTSPTQNWEWPRTGATDAYSREIADDEVPVGIQRAVYEAAWHEFQNPGELNISLRSDRHIAREQFGEVSFSYFVAGKEPLPSGLGPIYIPSVIMHLSPYLGGGTNGYGITGIVA